MWRSIVRLLVVSVTTKCFACPLTPTFRRLRAQVIAGLARVMQFYLHRATTCYHPYSYSPRGPEPEQPATLCVSAQNNNTELAQSIQQQWRQSTSGRAMQATSFIGTRCPGCKPRRVCYSAFRHAVAGFELMSKVSLKSYVVCRSRGEAMV